MDMSRFKGGGGNFIKGSDLDKPELVEIRSVDISDLPDGEKGCVEFTDDRKLTLNVTNTNKLCDMFGDESDAWIGEKIVIYAMDTEFRGQPARGVRVRAPKKAAPKPPPPETEYEEEGDDSVPF